MQVEYQDQQETNHKVLVILLKKIIELLGVEIKPLESVSVDNLDEVRAALRNELSALKKAFPDNKDVINELKQLQNAIKSIELSPNINVAGSTVTVPEIKIPDISIPEIHVPAPQVTVNTPEIQIPAPIVNVPAPIVNVEAVDIVEVIRALETNLNKLRTNSETRPLAVRISDGQKWVKELQQLNKEAARTTQFMSDVSYLRDVSGQRINPATAEAVSPPTTIGDGSKTVTTAGTRVQLIATATPCKYVIIVGLVTNTDTIWVGGSTVASGRGRPLVAIQSEKIDIDDVSKIWIDSVVSGEGISFTYVK